MKLKYVCGLINYKGVCNFKGVKHGSWTIVQDFFEINLLFILNWWRNLLRG